MWPFTRKYSLESSGIFRGFTDNHSHILPGVDDGIPDMEQALAVLAFYETLGVAKVVLTPHIMEECHLNGAVFLKERFREFTECYTGKIELSLGAEYMLDADFEKHLDSGNLLTVHGNNLLVETSCISKPVGFHDILEKIRSKGYFPLLAHPERYMYMAMDDYKYLKDTGVRFQLNLLSLAGSYGKNIREKSKKLLKAGYYDLAGTDIHNLRFFKSGIKIKFSGAGTLLQLNRR